MSPDQSQIDLVDTARAEESRQLTMHILIAREDDESCRAHVQPMDEPEWR